MKENKCILKPNLWLIRKQFFEQKTLKKVYCIINLYHQRTN